MVAFRASSAGGATKEECEAVALHFSCCGFALQQLLSVACSICSYLDAPPAKPLFKLETLSLVRKGGPRTRGVVVA